jgi:hypothetical protein
VEPFDFFIIGSSHGVITKSERFFYEDLFLLLVPLFQCPETVVT